MQVKTQNKVWWNDFKRDIWHIEQALKTELRFEYLANKQLITVYAEEYKTQASVCTFKTVRYKRYWWSKVKYKKKPKSPREVSEGVAILLSRRIQESIGEKDGKKIS